MNKTFPPLIFALLLSGCATAPLPPFLSEPNPCTDRGFASERTSSKFVYFSEPWRLRSVEGVITDPGHTNYLWIELRPARRLRPLREVQPDKDGHFRFSGVTEGTYCFKVWGPGWEIYVGTIIVSRSAPAAARLSFRMYPE